MMYRCSDWRPLIAEIGDNFPQSGQRLSWSDLWAYGIAAIVAAIAAAIVLKVRKYNDLTQRCDDPQKLFRELCHVHQLDRGSARLLAQLAAACQFEHPAQVFLTPAVFNGPQLPPSLRSQAAQYKRLQSRLFE
jgi:hypothetical protein